MSSSKIEELKKRRQKENKAKSSQIPYAAIFTVVAIVIYGVFLKINLKYSTFWIIGLLIGFTIQRSRFCFTASFRDPILVGNTSVLKAIIIAFIIMTIGFALVQYIFVGDSEIFDIYNIPGQIHPVGIHTAIGAIIFGIGMVISGGCASGTLMRIGEGFILQIVVLVGFIVGTLLGARQYEFWDKLFISKSPTVYIPQYIGLPIAMIGQIVILILLYFFVDWYDRKNNLMMM
ncbi:MAG: uncharacterized protein PWP27_2045 [Clostridiales bacterium]|jgi:hypothetical protein|nr:uncharacterized protein [Clostridiales bacterium]MDK2934235.1 uncharacterized protein [Clostridiales bacterium]